MQHATSHSRGPLRAAVEAGNVDGEGFWLYDRGGERYLPYADYPQFRHQTLRAILTVEAGEPGHVLWPQLGVRLSMADIDAHH